MRNKTAKKLRREAEMLTIGKSKHETRKQYRRMKKVYKLVKGEKI